MSATPHIKGNPLPDFIVNVVAPYAYTLKPDMMVAVICTSGCAQGRINRKPYISQTPSITVWRSGEILRYEHVSKDFSGFIIIRYKRFAGGLPSNMRERLSLRLAFADSPCLPLSSPELEAALSCCNLLRKTKQIKDVSACKEIDKLFDARLQGICRILFSPQARSEDFLSGFSKT
jgi:hypothetical protein